jgi:hypothetical protein
MGKKRVGKITLRRQRCVALKVLCAITILAACAVMFVVGEQSGVRTVKTIYKCILLTAVIGFIFKVVIRAVESYEEAQGG